MSTRRLSALVIGLLLAGSSTAPAQAPRTVEQAQAPAGRLGARTQIQVQPRMPNLVGQTFQAAQEDSRVTSLKLQLAAMRRPTAEQRPGVIVDQEPSPGSAVKPGMRVTVFVAVPPDKPPDQGRGQTDAPPRMPNLVGQPFDRAQQDSRVAGLKLRLIPRELPTSGQRPGVIIGHEPKPGDPVRPGSSVVAVVAVAEQKPPDRDGDTVKNVEVPRVVTMQAKDGASLLARRTLNAQAQFTDTSRAEPGTIVDQKPAPGTLVPQNSTVQILVSRARPDPPPNQTPDRNPVVGVRVPLVEGLEVRQGLALVSKFNLGARAQVVDTDRAAPGTIIDQNPDAGTLVVPPFTVTVVVARRPPSPPPPEDVKPDDVKPPPPVVPPPPPPPRLFPMPDLVGRSFPQAERDSRVADLQLRLNQQIDTRAGGLPNTIVRQSVSPGTSVPIGQAVTVFVASGVAVPRVIEQQADAAAERIVAVGLNPRRSEEVSELAPGTVLRQVPDPGVLVARGAAVGMTIAVPRKVVIPNVVGLTRAEAVQELARLRLRAAPVDDPGSRLPPQQVVTQVPIAGTEVVIGAAVQIAVATGIMVPDLSGLSAPEAQQAVAQLGLSFEDREAENDAAPANRVFEQQPAAGAAVARGSSVRVTLAIPAPVRVPDVTGATRAAAEQRLRAVRLTATVVQEASLPGPDRVDSQSPAAGATVRPGTAVTLRVAVGLLPRPPQPLPPQPPPSPDQPLVPDPARTDPQRTVRVPDLSGRARQEAEQMLIQVGLVARVTEADSTNPPDTVVRQDPAANAPVALATAVNVVVARQPPVTTTGAVAVVPPWLTILIVLIATVGVSTWKLWWPPWGQPPPQVVAQPAAPPPAPPLVDIEPRLGEWTQRLETTGRSLVEWDMRVRVWRGTPDHAVQLDGSDLVVEERRVYE